MAVQDPAGQAAGETMRPTRFNREVCAGLFLIIMAAVGYYGAFHLDAGSISGVGSGLMPKSISVLLALFGAFLIGLGLTRVHDRVEGFSLRGAIFIVGAIVAFAATVRPYGLLVAGPLAMLISSAADPDTRPIEILVFTIFMTACCVALFKFLLRLPIPLMPPLLGY